MEFYQEQLMIHGLQPHKAGKRKVVILCPFHNDTKPSLFVNINTGDWRCFGCKTEWAKWKTLADKLKMKTLSLDTEEGSGINPFPALVSEIESLAEGGYDQPPQNSLMPWVGDWRNMSQKFLRKLGAKHFYDNGVARIWFPVDVDEERVGWVARRLDKSKQTPWKNMKGDWASKALFPYNSVSQETDLLAVVEGPADALSLVCRGLPALALLGTTSWSKVKCSLLLAKIPKLVVLMLDNDRAGREATSKMMYRLRRIGLPFVVVNLPEGKDPDQLSDKEVHRLKRQLLKKVPQPIHAGTMEIHCQAQ